MVACLQPPLAVTDAEVAALDSLRAQMSQTAASSARAHSLVETPKGDWTSQSTKYPQTEYWSSTSEVRERELQGDMTSALEAFMCAQF